MEQILDLENRIIQFIEINDSFLDSEVNMNRAAIEGQQQAFQSVLELIKQLKKTGQIRRGNEYFPDSVEPMAKTKWEGGK